MLRVTGAASFVGSEFSFSVLTTILISVSLSNNFNWPSASVRFFVLVCFGLFWFGFFAWLKSDAAYHSK